MTPGIRAERPGDEAAIRELTAAAFAGLAHSDGSEPGIVDGLRASGDLALSLVAEDRGAIVGHAAFSPVTIDGEHRGWFGLGPVSVSPARQAQGIGGRLVDEGLSRLREAGAAGCVVLGDPRYYGRFGFAADPALVYPGPPAEYFQRLVLCGGPETGIVAYAPAFG